MFKLYSTSNSDSTRPQPAKGLVDLIVLAVVALLLTGVLCLMPEGATKTFLSVLLALAALYRAIRAAHRAAKGQNTDSRRSGP